MDTTYFPPSKELY